MSGANYVALRSGRVAALCQCCDRRSKSLKADQHGEPDWLGLPRGWSTAPYPHDFKHDDGSVGSTYTCPTCNRALRAGATLPTRDGRYLRVVVS